MVRESHLAEHMGSLPALVASAEVLKNKKEYVKAKEYFEKAFDLSPEDNFLVQRVTLVTYKAALPNVVSALLRAERILSVLNPEQSGDPETLGLSGSINKKLYEQTKDDSYLEKAIWFYERGFSLTQNYYNGINLAYLYLLKAATVGNRADAFYFYGKSVFANQNVISICIKLIVGAGFESRSDIEYIYQTLAQAYLGLDQNHEVLKLIPTINEVSKGSFDLDTFHEQNSKLIDAFVKFKRKYPDYQ